jgi:hypothetical protein
MVFSTQFDARDRIISNAGDRLKQLYEARVDSQGHIDLVESGTEDLYDYIQSFKESCDINTIVKRFAAGDTDVLARRQATYGDFTQLPGTYAELLNTVIQGENYFNSLPLETRAKFNHSFREWMASMDNMQEFVEKMGFSGEAPPRPAADPDSSTSLSAASPDVET